MRISFVKSLIQFDRRVLNQGVLNNSNYSAEELDNKLFFNNVFISNTDEIFERHNCSEILSDYVECLREYKKNINMIKRHIFEIDKSIKVGNDVTLVMEKMHDVLGDVNPTQIDTEKMVNGRIYFISPKRGVMVDIDPKHPVYSQPIIVNHHYYPTMSSITQYLNNTLGTDDIHPVSIVKDCNNTITKVVSYSKDIKSLLYIFPNTFIVYNEFIYTDDLSQLLDTNKAIEVQSNCGYSLNDIFNGDILIEYPEDSFMEFLGFISRVINEWGAKRIYLTLYRIGSDPAIFNLLKQAIMKGIKVYVNVELCATGEDINKEWDTKLREIGAHVTNYANNELKVHAKAVLIELLDGRSICQIGTGNYHTKTTSQYTDLSLITADDEICNNARRLFKLFNDKKVSFGNDLLVTRYNFESEFISLIRREAGKGKDGLIVCKCNSLDDDIIIDELQSAADSGCVIILIVRGVCTWIPDDGNVYIKSVVWDKLEHSRVYSFGSINPDIYIGSLDLVTNKIQRRIETLVRIKDPDVNIEICEYLNRYITTQDSWVMDDEGVYHREE